ncbi:hypothetical protein CPT_Moabite_035 [Serratia phage Moabite]|uniref:Uncharacterized protein n=2 Tax=Moabitevirus moabite TaxID=2846181 RepID=A0A7T3TLX6_9CAUD|nr:hypothetical protein HWC48_gp035 [Serratia phage Moabite]QPX76783.1 hypothetical protein [Serratia phage vB_SmaM_Yaphecito]UCR74576.1 hypothetical protein [Serratia phage BUCT660]UGO54252.1 hypothetical protein HAYMO_270 [Serratia phage vB_SmaM_Haymo]UQT03757.1 hypothetical protein KODAMA_02900 [Serratia phage vB_SmaM-Kodama]QDB71067.1 hypothetical protein CPT_Moabite_035 [Serratia phage Moabite]
MSTVAKVIVFEALEYLRLLENLCSVVEASDEMVYVSREGITHCILDDIMSGGTFEGSMRGYVFADSKCKMDVALEIIEEQRELLRNELTQVMMRQCMGVIKDASFIDNFTILGLTKSIAMRYLTNDSEMLPQQRISPRRNWGIRRRDNRAY